MDNAGEKQNTAMDTSFEVSGFVKMLSNEIRIPVNTIVGSTEIISHEQISDKVRETLVDIRQAADKLRILTGDMVDIVRIINNEMTFEDEEYRSEDVVLDIRQLIEHEAQLRGFEYSIDIDGNIPYRMFGDSEKIRQMLTKLIINAFEFGRHKVSLTAKCLPSQGSKVFLRFDITDDGLGVLKDETIKVLSGKGIDLKSGINGLDTSIVIVFLTRYFANRMGGKLTAKARSGEGCTFTLLIAQEAVGAATMDDHYEIGRTEPEVHIPFTAADARVLVVEESLMNARIDQGILGKYLINADITDNASDAITLIKRINYDFVMTDVNMPGRDGYELAEEVRRIGNENNDTRLVHMPIIGLSSNKTVQVAKKACGAGMKECLQKPIDSKEIERVIRDNVAIGKVNCTAEYSFESKGLQSLEALGLNTRAALANFMGDEDEYREVLITLCRSSDTKGKLLSRYLEQHDYKNYIVTMHGILGAAQVIGADDIVAKTRELERAAKQGLRDVIERETPEFADTFDKLLSSVRSALVTKDDTANKGAIDKEDLIAIIDELKAYLSEYQLNEVEELMFTLAQFSYPNQKVMESIHEAETAMLSYDYNEVTAALDKIKAELDME